MKKRNTLYFISSWAVILIGMWTFWYFMNHKVPEENKEYVIAIVGGFAGITLLAGYKVIGKDEALNKIETLSDEVKDWKTKHSICEGKLDLIQNRLHELENYIIKNNQ